MKLSLYLFKYPGQKHLWRVATVPPVLILDTRWRRVVSFTLRPLYHRGQGPSVLSLKKAGWSPWSDCTLWTGKNSLPVCPTEAYIAVLTKQL